jgi:hypothetical protein
MEGFAYKVCEPFLSNQLNNNEKITTAYEKNNY